jgi:hypothetical protein
MFCPQCGFEYTQKTNYCKRCGGNLSSSEPAPVTQPSGLKFTGVFLVIAALALFGLMQVYNIYMKMLYAGVRGKELFVPAVLGFVLIGAVTSLLTWLLSRLITSARKQTEQVERTAYFEPQPLARIAAPNDPALNVVERPSVAEHTTRQMASVYRNPNAPE